MLALIRLLASVGADVDSQRTALDEALTASGNRAGVRTFVGMNPAVSLQVRLAAEALLRTGQT